MSGAGPKERTAPSVVVEKLRAHADARGLLFEPLDEAELAAARNVHVVVTKPGEVRGNHSHRTATETTAVVGPCRVRWKDGAGVHDLDVPAGETWRLRIPPNVAHAYRNTGDGLMVLVSFSSLPHDPQGGDTVRETIL